jgi:hypothetical protein
MAVKLCSYCGESNREEAFMCVVCGSSLKGAELQGTPDAEKEFTGIVAGKPTVCRGCGEKLEPEALKCEYCGDVAIRAPRKPTIYIYREGSASGDGCAVALVFIATCIIPLVGLIVGGIFAFSDDRSKQNISKGLLVFRLIMIVVQIMAGILIM